MTVKALLTIMIITFAYVVLRRFLKWYYVGRKTKILTQEIQSLTKSSKTISRYYGLLVHRGNYVYLSLFIDLLLITIMLNVLRHMYSGETIWVLWGYGLHWFLAYIFILIPMNIIVNYTIVGFRKCFMKSG